MPLMALPTMCALASSATMRTKVARRSGSRLLSPSTEVLLKMLLTRYRLLRDS